MNDAADQGIEHLQTAAREMVSAARSFLDAVDEVIDDRDRFGSIANGLADLLERAGSVFSSASSSPGDTAEDMNGDTRNDTAPATSTRPRKGTSRVQRIPVE